MKDIVKGVGWLMGIAAILPGILALSVFPWGDHPPLAFQDETLKAGLAVATALLVVTLFVERSMAAFNALIFGEKERRAMLTLWANANDEEAANALVEVMKWKERLRLLLAFGAGLFVATAGVRTLAGLFKLTKDPTALFHNVDILLTAGLIAGGSNGLAFLIQALKAVIQANAPKPALATHIVTTS